MPSFKRGDVVVGRVISEDSEYMLIEVGKSDSVSFHLDPAPENNRFHTLLFVQFKDGEPTFKKPWDA